MKRAIAHLRGPGRTRAIAHLRGPGRTRAVARARRPAPAAIEFPAEFLWGAATSAYQIEGSPLADGAGPSNWHRFAHTPGLTHEGATGDVACDHYRRFEEDIALMSEIGLRAYRFSISWSRVLPEGRGRVNPRGLDFYSRLVDRLLERGIAPLVTLFHWDLPAALEDSGGWLNAEVAEHFAEYAGVLGRALGDRVPLWATLNEPWVVVDAGYVHGVHAPGHRNIFEAPIAAHNLLRAHGAGVRALRAECRSKIGLVVNLEPKEPATAKKEDAAAAERAAVYMNRAFLDPALLGRYPEGLALLYGEAWPEFPAEDLRLIAEPLDFVGVNYYFGSLVRGDDGDWPARARTVLRRGAERTETGWEVYPEGLTRTLVALKERYGSIPLYITENGAAMPDPTRARGARVHDPRRVEYFRRHLAAAHEAIRLGVDLRGYFAWSLMDNLEWSAGFSKRFGLIHVDFETQKRTLKDSALFYRDVILSRGRVLGEANGGRRKPNSTTPGRVKS